MTSAKSEIILKISQLPEAKPAPNNKIEVRITDQNDITFTALLNLKSWKKAVAASETFSSWVGTINGKLAQNNKGLQILDAGIVIFEKKEKPMELKP